MWTFKNKLRTAAALSAGISFRRLPAEFDNFLPLRWTCRQLIDTSAGEAGWLTNLMAAHVSEHHTGLSLGLHKHALSVSFWSDFWVMFRWEFMIVFEDTHSTIRDYLMAAIWVTKLCFSFYNVLNNLLFIEEEEISFQGYTEWIIQHCNSSMYALVYLSKTKCLRRNGKWSIWDHSMNHQEKKIHRRIYISFNPPTLHAQMSEGSSRNGHAIFAGKWSVNRRWFSTCWSLIWSITSSRADQVCSISYHGDAPSKVWTAFVTLKKPGINLEVTWINPNPAS